jgi:uncharacterized protein with HEPN domain
MAGPSPLPRLIDIIEAIELIRGEMAGVTLKAFEPDRRKRWLVERGIEIISEASRRLSARLHSCSLLDPPWRLPCCIPARIVV